MFRVERLIVITLPFVPSFGQTLWAESFDPALALRARMQELAVPQSAIRDPQSSEKLSPEQTQRFFAQLKEKHQDLLSLQVDFVQERRMLAFEDVLTAQGTCYLQVPDKLRWELKAPCHSALVFREGRIVKFLYEKGRVRRLNPGSKEVMAEVLEMIARCMQGNLEFSRKIFDVAVERSHLHVIRLTPRSERLKRIISDIELQMDQDSKHVNKVIIYESRGDRIEITFFNKKWNKKLDDSLFALD